jgi:hypothetical protein
MANVTALFWQKAFLCMNDIKAAHTAPMMLREDDDDERGFETEQQLRLLWFTAMFSNIQVLEGFSAFDEVETLPTWEDFLNFSRFSLEGLVAEYEMAQRHLGAPAT